jgi:hypothetical protein
MVPLQTAAAAALRHVARERRACEQAATAAAAVVQQEQLLQAGTAVVKLDWLLLPLLRIHPLRQQFHMLTKLKLPHIYQQQQQALQQLLLRT